MTQSPTILWQIHDDKPGHHNQLRGLTQALAESMPLEVHAIAAPARRQSLASLWSKQFPPGNGLPDPDLVVGAGHATHLAVLAARRARGGRAIVLMKPSLPTALFDLCLIPEHDGVAPSERVVTTRGVLNVVRPSQAHDPGQGLLLVGGPSSAHDWSDEQMLQQIQTILSSDPDLRWQLTTSRRTPASFVAQLANCQLPNLKVTPHQQTSPDWLPQQLARAGQVWVSEDSVSMVYEALTSGAAVGILQVPTTRQRSRVATGVAALLRNQWATRFADWQPGTPLTTPPEQLDEARRCAQTICQKLAAA